MVVFTQCIFIILATVIIKNPFSVAIILLLALLFIAFNILYLVQVSFCLLYIIIVLQPLLFLNFNIFCEYENNFTIIRFSGS